MNKVVKIGKDLRRITNEELEQFRLNFSIFTKCDIAPFNTTTSVRKRTENRAFLQKVSQKKFSVVICRPPAWPLFDIVVEPNLGKAATVLK